MMNDTARTQLPLLVPGQSSKELFHNEALQICDILLCPVVESVPSSSPPASPSIGQCYAVAVGASGSWAGQDYRLAGWTAGGWRFVAVPEGSEFRVRPSGLSLVRISAGWELGQIRADEIKVAGQTVVRSQQAAITTPAGGTTVDVQARTAIAQILTALRNHGLIAT